MINDWRDWLTIVLFTLYIGILVWLYAHGGSPSDTGGWPVDIGGIRG